MDAASFIDKSFTYAVVGASNDPTKYGFKVVGDLQRAGFKVVPVNPREQEIRGLAVSSSLAAAPCRVDVVVFVVPPAVTEEVLGEVVSLGIRKVWLQPGAESEKAIAFCEEHGIACVHGACIMLSH